MSRYSAFGFLGSRKNTIRPYPKTSIMSVFYLDKISIY